LLLTPSRRILRAWRLSFKPGLEGTTEALEVARATLGAIRQNLFRVKWKRIKSKETNALSRFAGANGCGKHSQSALQQVPLRLKADNLVAQGFILSPQLRHSAQGLDRFAGRAQFGSFFEMPLMAVSG
jgi:hypothetical protein